MTSGHAPAAWLASEWSGMGSREHEAGHDHVAFSDQVLLDRDLEAREAAEQLLVVLGDLLPEARAEVAVDRPALCWFHTSSTSPEMSCLCSPVDIVASLRACGPWVGSRGPSC